MKKKLLTVFAVTVLIFTHAGISAFADTVLPWDWVGTSSADGTSETETETYSADTENTDMTDIGTEEGEPKNTETTENNIPTEDGTEKNESSQTEPSVYDSDAGGCNSFGCASQAGSGIIAIAISLLICCSLALRRKDN